jgi:hypothetical protein
MGKWGLGIGRGGGGSFLESRSLVLVVYCSILIHPHIFIYLLFSVSFLFASGTILPLLSVSSCFKRHYAAVLVGKNQIIEPDYAPFIWNLWSVLLFFVKTSHLTSSELGFLNQPAIILN